ncbi:MAG: hypothetical protein VX278_03040 [Myxococcota bacterium]|nr:hypothetical protein [Myxococcota bacterium]
MALSSSVIFTPRLAYEELSAMTPEQQEIEQKKQEIVALEDQLADAEVRYAAYYIELKYFESLFLEHISPLYASLDRWNMRLQSTDIMLSKLRDIRDQVSPIPEDPFMLEIECAQQIRLRWQENHQLPQSAPKISTVTETQDLYRTLTRRFHPDLVVEDDARAQRTELMSKINEAYREQDIQALQAFIEHPNILPTEEEAEATLVRLIRRVAQLKSLLKESQQRHESITKSALGKLMAKAQTDLEEHGDPFLSIRGMLEERLENTKFLWLNQRVREAHLWTEVDR